MKIRVIVNPRAGAGAAGKRISTLEAALRRTDHEFRVVTTTRPADATRLARIAREDGVDVIVIVGGDGTVNELAQAYVDSSGHPIAGPHLALVPAGTGGDFRRSFEISRDPLEALARFRSSTPRPLDLGVVSLTADDGSRITRAFLNIASFGVAGQIDRIVNDSPKWMGGRAAFFLGTLRGLASYRNASVRLSIDDAPWYEGRVVNVAIANGRYFGGGMQVAPHADPADGLFDVVVLGDFSLGESLGLTRKIYSGKHLSVDKVLSTRAKRVVAEPGRPGPPVLVDMDGEAPGRLPLSAEIFPGALRIVA
jgi:YegS/Rv2252/BmrU family lipid kinase